MRPTHVTHSSAPTKALAGTPIGHFFVKAADFLSGHPLWFALVAVFALYVLYWIISASPNLLTLALGHDGRLSTSKLQSLMWTFPVLFVAIANFIASFGETGMNADFSPNLLIVLGLSYGTAVGAKAITVGYVAGNTGMKLKPVSGDCLELKYLIQNDDGTLDIGKFQMLAWTIVAIATFLYAYLSNSNAYAHCQVHASSGGMICFPDINPTLMVLMGLSQGSYIGGKIVATNAQPTVNPPTVQWQPGNASVTIIYTGTGLVGGALTVDGAAPASINWTGGTLTLVVANPKPTAAGTSVAIAPGFPLVITGTINGVTFTDKVVI